MSYVKIRNALETKLAAFAATKSLPVVWENIAATPTTSYIKATIFTADTQDPSIGNNHRRYGGVFRVQFMCTDVGKGMKPVEAFADSILAYFPRGLKLVKDDITVNITNTGSARTPGYETNYIYITVDFIYRTDVLSV